jgi:hypothetical protein
MTWLHPLQSKITKELRAKMESAIRNAHAIGPSFKVPGTMARSPRADQMREYMRKRCSQR